MKEGKCNPEEFADAATEIPAETQSISATAALRRGRRNPALLDALQDRERETKDTGMAL